MENNLNSKITILHNSNCSKSNAVLHLLEKNQLNFEIRYYLNDPLNKHELMELKEKLNFNSPKQMMRQKESIFIEKNLSLANEAQLIDSIIEFPILLERPIVIYKKNAKIGRPPENVLLLLSELIAK